ncbi:ABC transporter transmembrane domain-containing protein [Trueperella sp.]|uniref:ABC transporter transmembrane domain-containing protein n=1 Tax=Trueperella sp. TaxID=2699835 RepID=UPI003735A073
MSRVSTGDRAIAAQTVALGIRALSIGVAYIALGKVIGTGFDTSVDVRWVVVGVGALVVAALCDFANGLSQATSAGSEEKRMRRALLAHAFGLGPARFSGHESGRLVSLMTDSVERVANYRQGYVGQLVGAILTPFITLVLIAIMIDWLTALILLACLPFVPLLIGVFQRRFRKDSARSRQVRGKLASQFLESIQNLPTLVGLRAADRVGTTLAKTGEENRVALMKVLARNQLLLFVTEAVFALFLVRSGLRRLGSGCGRDRSTSARPSRPSCSPPSSRPPSPRWADTSISAWVGAPAKRPSRDSSSAESPPIRPRPRARAARP